MACFWCRKIRRKQARGFRAFEPETPLRGAHACAFFGAISAISQSVNKDHFMRQKAVTVSCRHLAGMAIFFALSAQSCALFSGSSETKTNSAATVSAASAQPQASSGGDASAVRSQTSASSGIGDNSDLNRDLNNASSAAAGGEHDASAVQTAEDYAVSEYERAAEAYRSGRFAEAFGGAIRAIDLFQNASSPSEMRSEAETLAIAAAEQCDPVRWMQMNRTASSPAARSILSRLLAAVCLRQNDRSCVAAQARNAADAADALGDAENAERWRSAADSLYPELPVAAVLLPLSGKDRRMGRAMLGSFLLASGVYDHRDLPFVLRFFDTRSDAAEAGNIAASLAAHNIRLVLGPVDVLESMKTAQNLAGDAVMIGFSPNGAFSDGRPNVFQFAHTLDREAQAVAEFIVDTAPRRAISAAPQDAYSETALASVNAYLPPQMQLSAQTYPASQTDLRDVAKRIAAQSPDLIFFPAQADDAERLASFLAQENVWCRAPGAAPAQTSSDARRFAVCLSAGAWAPIPADHRYKFIVNGIYLDYASAGDDIDAAFSQQFSALYHRLPSVYEVMPHALVSALRKIPERAWQSGEALQSAASQILRGNRYILNPALRIVAPNGSAACGGADRLYSPAGGYSSDSSSANPLPVRSLTVK